MSQEQDVQTATLMSDTLMQIEIGELEFADGVNKLNGQIQQLNAIPVSWKNKLLELSQELAAHGDDEQVVGGIMERIEKAIGLIQNAA